MEELGAGAERTRRGAVVGWRVVMGGSAELTMTGRKGVVVGVVVSLNTVRRRRKIATDDRPSDRKERRG